MTRNYRYTKALEVALRHVGETTERRALSEPMTRTRYIELCRLSRRLDRVRRSGNLTSDADDRLNVLNSCIERFELRYNRPKAFLAYLEEPSPMINGIDTVVGHRWVVTTWGGHVLGYATGPVDAGRVYMSMDGRDYYGRLHKGGHCVMFRALKDKQPNGLIERD